MTGLTIPPASTPTHTTSATIKNRITIPSPHFILILLIVIHVLLTTPAVATGPIWMS